MPPKVGVIANPISGRDIRRVIAKANNLQVADRANILLRALAGLAACGVDDVVMMPERGGVAAHVLRQLAQSSNRGELCFPRVSLLDMPVTGAAVDSRRAARMMSSQGVAAIMVLGGDGTHRVVAAECGGVPIAGISTGTNNAFPEMREPTTTGLATGLVATGAVPTHMGVKSNKWLETRIDDGAPEIALVDVAIVSQQNLGARALWRAETFRELYVAFADPQLIGMSAIAALLEPVGRDEPGGLTVQLAPAGAARLVVRAPIAPGLVEPVGVEEWRRLPAGRKVFPRLAAGSIALDGERELSFDRRQRVSIELVERAFSTIDVASAMRFAAAKGLLRDRNLACA
ncbi:NAD(+)/NADH kinase [Rhodoblastus acidophilus]|uniref:NAD(+)/NADH kinase n=1 Tax=Candidatus Rhodoblastus alkanivorans TaxID=2954117 RepID=A0ABS9Z1U9_9HYPH|nr:NAD(+)/NADH kinase [Candidatus Rhodoblastus alkanivorans]MCI4678020.1 NAD(+)/NADH kinase [Candidatus Rhodoblastus alkanivorans]MCI4681640.1 NAD(+)/NADH kinase [Candidatus Rhodoblastus alkanivorans]MDI4642687.1 NAD(+)/NADH kinase [Rhodoblastus acidophilus]